MEYVLMRDDTQLEKLVRIENTRILNSTFYRAHFRLFRFERVDLSGTILPNDLSGGDLSSTTNARLDGNLIRDTRFAPFSNDRWSILRRNYTGPRLLFHLLFLIAFVVPYAAKVLEALAVNNAQKRIVELAEFAHKAEGKAGVSRDEDARIRMESAARMAIWGNLAQLKPCLADKCADATVLAVLVGLDRGWQFALMAACLICYNILRVLLTWQVGALREEEERSHYAPTHRSHAWLYWMHRFAFGLLFINIASLVYHAYDWLTRPISIAAGL
jgi:hypothetical protein